MEKYKDFYVNLIRYNNIQIPIIWDDSVETGLPDFIGIGTQRSGTSRWFHLIAQHPEIDIPYRYANIFKESQFVHCGVKERHFFDKFVDEKIENIEEVKKQYMSLFPRTPGKITGEWTPGYMFKWWCIPLIGQVSPSSKFLILLRDPYERYLSGHAHANLKKSYSPSNIGHNAFERSLYSKQLERVFKIIPKEQILVLQFEQTLLNPGKQLQKTFEFLNVDPKVEIKNMDEIVNPSKNEKIDLTIIKNDLCEIFLEEKKKILEIFPDFDGSLWKIGQ